MSKALSMFLSLVLFAAVALAHGNEQHVMGTVSKVTDKSITIDDVQGKSVELGLGADTKYMKGEAAADLKDVKVGDRVVVHAKKVGDRLVATTVRIGAAAAPAGKP